MNEQINKVSKINKKIMPQKPAKDNGKYGKSLSIVRLSLVRKSVESLPKYDKTKVNSHVTKVFFDKYLI